MESRHGSPELARRHPEIDVAVMHLGGTRVLLHTVTMDGEQGVDFLRRVRPGQAIPVHYDDHKVFRSPLSEIERLAATAGLRHLSGRSVEGKPSVWPRLRSSPE